VVGLDEYRVARHVEAQTVVRGLRDVETRHDVRPSYRTLQRSEERIAGREGVVEPVPDRDGELRRISVDEGERNVVPVEALVDAQSLTRRTEAQAGLADQDAHRTGIPVVFEVLIKAN
jgi:hypothetical protein